MRRIAAGSAAASITEIPGTAGVITRGFIGEIYRVVNPAAGWASGKIGHNVRYGDVAVASLGGAGARTAQRETYVERANLLVSVGGITAAGTCAAVSKIPETACVGSCGFIGEIDCMVDLAADRSPGEISDDISNSKVAIASSRVAATWTAYP